MPERMSNVQAVVISREIRSGWPHQKFDEITTDLWAQSLRAVDPPLGFEDCRAAIRSLVMIREFGGPAAILDSVRRIRCDRLDRTEMPAPNVNPDHVTDYVAEHAAIRAAIADGDFDADVYRSSGLTLTGVPGRLAITAVGEPLVERPALSRELVGMFHRPEKPLPVHYGPKPLAPVKDVPPEEIARREAERDRQIAALATTYGAASTRGGSDG